MSPLLVHATEAKDDGCPFDHLFSTTPADLVTGGLFRDIACKWFSRPGHREVSIALIAQKLGGRRERLRSGSRAKSPNANRR
eukprot:3987421-Prymnesium_polylepis.1